MGTKIDMIGETFGEGSIVLRENGKTESGNTKWLCRCGCGNYFTTTGSNIRTGISKSCRCLAGKMGKKQLTIHGLRYHPLYNIWAGMKSRCNDHDQYPRYADKKIIICQEWENDFEAFYNFAIKNGWGKGLAIDRKNNFGNYCPDNVRFVTYVINNQNTIKSKRWFINDKKYQSSREAAEKEGVSQCTICHWCDGYKSRGKYYPPKNGCYSERLYQK